MMSRRKPADNSPHLTLKANPAILEARIHVVVEGNRLVCVVLRWKRVGFSPLELRTDSLDNCLRIRKCKCRTGFLLCGNLNSTVFAIFSVEEFERVALACSGGNSLAVSKRLN